MTSPLDESERREAATNGDPPSAGPVGNGTLPSKLPEQVIDALRATNRAPERSRLVLIGPSGDEDAQAGLASQVTDVVARLRAHRVDVVGYDTSLDVDDDTFDVPLQSSLSLDGFDGVVVFAPDPAFRERDLESVVAALADEPVLVDATGGLDANAAADLGAYAISYWGI